MANPIYPQGTVRLSVPLTPQVLHAFTELSGASGRSLASLVAQWLDDTVGGVHALRKIAETHRAMPGAVAQRLTLLMDNMSDLAQELEHLRAASAHAPAGAPGARKRATSPKSPPPL